MPDHYRQQPADPMVPPHSPQMVPPRSPPDHDQHPLALVIGKDVIRREQKARSQPLQSHVQSVQEQAVQIPAAHMKSSIPEGHEEEDLGSSPDRSSGFSDHASSTSPEDEEDMPLALVVEKTVQQDSGHEEDTMSNEEFQGLPEVEVKKRSDPGVSEQRVEIRPSVTIAKIVREDNNNTKVPGLKVREFAKVNPEDLDTMSDMTSEVSSIDTDHLFRARSSSHLGHPTPDLGHPNLDLGHRTYSCPHCAKTFGHRSSLKTHLATHSSLACPLCAKVCPDHQMLQDHISSHSVCADRASLEDQMRQQNDEKPFVCGVCAKAYARKSHLNVHYRVHTGERPFVCSRCDKDFTEKRFLNDHVQTAHTAGQEGPLRCANCFREFAYKTSLKQHLKKQMCVKNINRGQQQQQQQQQQSSSASSVSGHAKQFQCPFCEKSYSWKQTLKQHVSMYHRNKVDTDEFWRYELSKHRRNGVSLDNPANEDMWKKQLGKHAQEELEKRENRSKAEEEIKMMALQSLQMISNIKSEGYWSLLNQLKEARSDDQSDHMAARSEQMVARSEKMVVARSEDLVARSEKMVVARSEDLVARSEQLVARSEDIEDHSSSPLPDLTEEPAAKRTQTWLAQLGQYRQRSLLQEELDRNHEEMWEEQISRGSKPQLTGKSPLEITLDDEEPEKKSLMQQVIGDAKISARPRMVPLMSALQLHPPPPSATITKPQPPSESEDETFCKPNYPEVKKPEPKKLPLSLDHELGQDLSRASTPALSQTSSIKDKPKEEYFLEKEDTGASFLQSILMDRCKRKRPSEDVRPPQTQVEQEPNDILRRRLLGLKDEEPPCPKIPNLNKDIPTTKHQETKPMVHQDTKFMVHQDLRSLAHQDIKSWHQDIKSMSHQDIKSMSHQDIKSMSHQDTKSMSHQDPRSMSHQDLKSLVPQWPSHLLVPPVPTGNLHHLEPKKSVASPKEDFQLKNEIDKDSSQYAHTSVLKHLLHRYTAAN